MTRVTGPLFSDTAHGPIAGLGSFRMGRHGPEFIATARTTRPPSVAQTALRALFAEAMAEWRALTPPRPPWATFWAEWYAEHTQPQQGLSWLHRAIYGDAQLAVPPLELTGVTLLENPP